MFESIEMFYDISDEQRVCWVMEKNTPVDAPQRGYDRKMEFISYSHTLMLKKSSFMISGIN